MRPDAPAIRIERVQIAPHARAQDESGPVGSRQEDDRRIDRVAEIRLPYDPTRVDLQGVERPGARGTDHQRLVAQREDLGAAANLSAQVARPEGVPETIE